MVHLDSNIYFNLLQYCFVSVSLLYLNPFSAKPIFGRKKKKNKVGNFIATLVFMLEREREKKNNVGNFIATSVFYAREINLESFL